MSKRWRAGVLLSLLGLAACQGPVLPLSAQQGSTVAIALRAEGPADPPMFGYGGLAMSDPQRGSLQFSLATPSGPFPLVTRGTSKVLPHVAADAARGSVFITTQVFSLVDIPANAPVGTYDVDVKRVYTDPATGQTLEQPISYNGTLTVLPSPLVVSLPSGGTQTVTGAPTTTAYWGCELDGSNCFFRDASASVFHVIPKPEIRIQLSNFVWAAKVSVSYPAAVVNVVDSFEPALNRVNHRALVWLQDNPTSGTVTVDAVGSQASFSALSVIFDLDNPSQILNPAGLQVTVLGAWDQSGAPISSVTGTVSGIY